MIDRGHIISGNIARTSVELARCRCVLNDGIGTF